MANLVSNHRISVEGVGALSMDVAQGYDKAWVHSPDSRVIWQGTITELVELILLGNAVKLAMQSETKKGVKADA